MYQNTCYLFSLGQAKTGLKQKYKSYSIKCFPKTIFINPRHDIKEVLNASIFQGVCFLVGSLFMAMVGLEMICEKAMEKYDSIRGKNEAPEAHPADLVGKFSRYKWYCDYFLINNRCRCQARDSAPTPIHVHIKCIFSFHFHQSPIIQLLKLKLSQTQDWSETPNQICSMQYTRLYRWTSIGPLPQSEPEHKGVLYAHVAFVI